MIETGNCLKVKLKTVWKLPEREETMVTKTKSVQKIPEKAENDGN